SLHHPVTPETYTLSLHDALPICENGGLVARTRTDFEHDMIGCDLGQLCHQGHDERLRYGLAAADRKRHVRVCDRAGSLGNEQMADRKSTRLSSSHLVISYAVFCL